MKNYLLLLVSIIFCFYELSAQCSSCDIALAKDYFSNQSSLKSSLNLLMLINKENYEQIKNDKSISWETGGNYLQLYSGFFNGNETWNEFQEKRSKLFQQFSYNQSSSQAQQETKLVTNKIAYNYWSACIIKCFENDENTDRVYAYITGADENHIYLRVKYKATSNSKKTQTCKITVDSGIILNEGRRKTSIWPSSGKQKTFKIERLDNPQFTIIREGGAKSTSIAITADGNGVFGETIYFGQPNKHNYSGVLNYTVLNRRDTFVRRESVTFNSPPIFAHSILNDVLGQLNKKWPGYFVRNGEDAVRNTIELPDLPSNQYYKNFSNIQCIVDNDNSCKLNIDKGLDEKIDTSSNGKKVNIKFTTAFNSCTWKWSADVIQIFEDSISVKDPVLISDRYFIVRVPKNATGSVMTVNIDNNQYLIIPGHDEQNLKVKFISFGQDGSFNYYSYFIKDE